MLVTLGAFAGASLFGVGPTKSAAMVFGPGPDCHVHLGGVPLPFVTQQRYFGVVFTPDSSWRAYVAHVSSRGDRLFHQSSAWCHGERLPVRFAVSVFDTSVLSNAACFGLEFVGDAAAVAKFNQALRRWCRQLLGWPAPRRISTVWPSVCFGPCWLSLSSAPQFSGFVPTCGALGPLVRFSCVLTVSSYPLRI